MQPDPEPSSSRVPADHGVAPPSRRSAAGRLGVGVAALVALLVAVAASGLAEPDGSLALGGAVVLGLVEGITEWLPISSTGHLLVAQDLMGVDGDAADSYAIAIQAGAILAVLGLYRDRFVGILQGLRGRSDEGRRTLVAIVVACLPAVTAALLLEDTIKGRLFGTWPVVVAWLVGGAAILAFARSRRGVPPTAGASLTALGWRGALVVGLAQSLALWPGVSRSLVTILGATAVGLSVPAAVEFSFLLGFVVLGGATFYETVRSGSDMVEAYGVATPLVGVVVAFVASVVAMRWMVAYLNRRGLGIFGWYRLAAGGLAALLLVTGVL